MKRVIALSMVFMVALALMVSVVYAAPLDYSFFPADANYLVSYSDGVYTLTSPSSNPYWTRFYWNFDNFTLLETGTYTVYFDAPLNSYMSFVTWDLDTSTWHIDKTNIINSYTFTLDDPTYVCLSIYLPANSFVTSFRLQLYSGTVNDNGIPANGTFWKVLSNTIQYPIQWVGNFVSWFKTLPLLPLFFIGTGFVILSFTTAFIKRNGRW